MMFLLVVQVATFLGMAACFAAVGQYRLSFAQFLLAIVQATIYTGTMK
ncbi:hypothetical protein [Sphingomonas sp.]|jgi:hypothetical protein